MSRNTLPGSIFLGIVAILPAFAVIAGVNNQFAQFYGGAKPDKESDAAKFTKEIGKSIMACAKIIGITPAAFIFNGIY